MTSHKWDTQIQHLNDGDRRVIWISLILRKYLIFKRGRSANKFRKSLIRKIAEFFINLRTVRKCGNYRICDLRIIYFLRFADLRFTDPINFCELKLPQGRKNISITLTNVGLKVPKREIFDRSDFPDFHTIKSLRVGDFGAKIKKFKKYLGVHLGVQSSLCVCSVYF